MPLCENPSCNETGATRQCSRCKYVRYCSVVCQRSHWQAHKGPCRAAADMFASDPDQASFSLAELCDPNDIAAANARSQAIPYGKLYNEHFLPGGNKMTYDRFNPAGPHAQAWASNRGFFYVATDVAQIKFEDTDLPQGQYYRRSSDSRTEWSRYDSGNTAPGNVGGFHRAVIDTEQPGSSWTLSAKGVSTNIMGMELVGPTFVAFARVDYAGFVSCPGQKDQCRGHLKIKDFASLTTGRILIQDIIYSAEFEDVPPSCNHEGTNSSSYSAHHNGVVDAPMDGYFPITVHRDRGGKIDLIMVKMI